MFKGFKNTSTAKTEVWKQIEEPTTYVIFQRTGQNMYDVHNSSVFSTGDWDMTYRFTGTRNQVSKWLETKLK